MAPKFVAPYRMSGKRGKNDAADAAAICEAVQRPNMRFVPVKSEEQQARLMRAPRAPGLRRAAHRHDQPHPRPAQRVRHRAAAEGRHRAPRGRRAPGGSARLGQHGHRRLCSARCTGWTSASRSTTATSRRWPPRTSAASRLMQLQGVGATTATRAGGDDRQRPRVQERPPARRLARPGARPVQLGRQDATGTHHQGRRRATCARCWCWAPSGARRGQEQERPAQPLGDGAGRSDAATGRRSSPSPRRTRAWPGRCSPRARASSRSRPEHRSHSRTSRFPPPRDDASVDESRVGPARGVLDHLEETTAGRPRLTNEAPARVFHQGPQHSNAASMTGCSFAVRTLGSERFLVGTVTDLRPCLDVSLRDTSRLADRLTVEGSPCSDMGRPARRNTGSILRPGYLAVP